MSRRGLTKDQKKRVGSYFAKNYREGELVCIPDLDAPSWKDWMERRLKEVGFYDKNGRRSKTNMAPPRIFLRKGAKKKEIKESGLKFDNKGIGGEHYEFKVWLQHKVEEARIGSGSLRILASEGADSEFEEYQRTFEILADGIESLFDREILRVGEVGLRNRKVTKLDSIATVVAEIEGVEKKEFRQICEATVRSLISTSHTRIPEPREIFDIKEGVDPDGFMEWGNEKLGGANEVSEEEVEEELERIFTRNGQFPRDDPANNGYADRFEKRIYNKSRIRGSDHEEKKKEYRKLTRRRLVKQRLCERKIEPEDDWNRAEITCPAIVIVPDLAKRIEDIISKLFDTLAKEKGGTRGKEILGNLPPEEQEEIEKIFKTGFKGNEKTTSKDESNRHFSRQLAYNVITMLQNDGLLTTRPMKEAEQIEQFFQGDEVRFDKYSQEGRYKNWPNVYRFEEKLLDLFGGDKGRDAGKVTYAHFCREKKNKDKMENAIFRFLRASRSRWMYCLPEKHDTGTSDEEDFSSRLGIDKFKRDGSGIVHIAEDFDGDLERKDGGRKEGGFILRESYGRRTEMYKDRDDYEGFIVEVKGVKEGSRRCRPDKSTTDALNKLQSIQWEINLDLLEKLFKIEFDEEGGDTLEKLREAKKKEIKESGLKFDNKENKGDVQLRGVELLKEAERYIHNITPKDELLPNENDGREGYFDKESLEEMGTSILDWVKKIVNHNANVFWHPWHCDFRGRLYPRCPGLSPVGGDISKALIRFKKWKGLGKKPDDKQGINWFKRHLHSLMEGVDGPWGDDRAKKGVSFEARQKWVDKHQKELREMGRNPLGKENMKWLSLHKRKSGKEGLQRIAALIEFDRLMEEYQNQKVKDWSKVKSGLAINLDGSCNGYQHISTLLRNPDLARSVNVIPVKNEGNGKDDEGTSEVMGDLYSAVAIAAKKTEHAHELREKLVEELKGRAGIDCGCQERLADEAMEKIFSRNVAKKPTMTRAYGATKFDKALAGKNQQGSKDRSLTQMREFTDKEKEERNKINRRYPHFENSWFEYQQNPYDRRKNPRGKRKKHFAKHVKIPLKKGQLEEILGKHTLGERQGLLEKYRGLGRISQINGRSRKLGELTVDDIFEIISGEKSIKDSPYDLEWNEKDKKIREALEKEGEKWGKKFFQEEKTFELWAEGSGLRSALSSNQELWMLFRYSKASPIKESGKLWKMQPEITKLVGRAYTEGIDNATGKAYKKFEERMRGSLKRSQGKYPGVRWVTTGRIDSDEDGFEVSNYYMKTDDSGNRRSWPTKPSSCFKHMSSIPEWYSNEEDEDRHKGKRMSRGRVKEKIKLFLKDSGVDEPDYIAGWWGSNSDMGRDLALNWLERADIPGSEELAKTCKALFGHINITIPQYVDHEFDRLKAICENKVKKGKKEEKCNWESPQVPIETFDVDERKELEKKFLEGIGGCDSCGSSEELKIKTTAGRIDFKAAEKAVSPNFIHSLDACHMRTAINEFCSDVQDFGFFAIHDSFGTHACDVEEMRRTVIRTFWEMHEGRSLDYWLGKMEGANGKAERWKSLMDVLGPNGKAERWKMKKEKPWSVTDEKGRIKKEDGFVRGFDTIDEAQNWIDENHPKEHCNMKPQKWGVVVLKDVEMKKTKEKAESFTILTPYEAEVIKMRENLRESLKIFKENWNKSEYLIA